LSHRNPPARQLVAPHRCLCKTSAQEKRHSARTLNRAPGQSAGRSGSKCSDLTGGLARVLYLLGSNHQSHRSRQDECLSIMTEKKPPVLSTSFLGCCFSQHALIKFVRPLRRFLDSSIPELRHGRSYLATFAGNRKRCLSAQRAARPVSTTETYSRR